MFVGSGALATLTTTTLKFLILRERPPVADRLTIESTFSFPSGHSSSAAAFLVAGALVLVTLAPKLKPWAWIITPLLVASVMASRLYLGVHWFTDVVAGASVGTAAALFAFWVYQRFSPDARAEDAGSSPLRSIRAERVRE